MSNPRPPSSGEHADEGQRVEPETEALDPDGLTQPGLPVEDCDQATLPPEPTASPTRSNSSSAIGSTFGDYEILNEIARGGMGVIYRARHKSLDRVVALKMILSGQFASEEEIRRFNAESTAAAQLDHPNIVPIYDSGVQGENHFFSMKLIEGRDLGREMQRLRSDLKSGVALIEKICRAIHHAHQRGILHRDLKPANILLDAEHEPYLTDLGLARHVGSDNQLTRTGAVVGTPSYMPPEQAAGSADITTAVDIYSLGAILYELLAGRPPFQSDNVMATLMQVINDSPERPSLSGMTDRNLEMIAMKCLSKSPTERYSTAEALADDLQRWLRGEPVSVRAPSFSAVARNWLRKNFGNAIWILVVGIVAGVLAGWGLWLATIQREMTDIRSVYEELPSVKAPFTLASWNTPSWAVIPSMVVFTTAVMFMGYLTAALARTKDKSADLAAGIIVGVISAAAVFFICFGTLSVLAMGFGNNDIVMLSKASAVPDGEMTPDLQDLLDDYPELSAKPRAEQIQVILRKIESDTLYQARNGIALGTLSSLLVFLTAGVIETVLAGPIIRSSPNLGAALAEYVFRSYPFVVATVIVGVHATGFVVLGHHGIIWNGFQIVTFIVLAIGMFAELRRWHWGIRLPLVLFIGFLFAGFFAYSFSMMPVVAQSTVEVNKRLRLAERNPGNLRLKNRVVNAILGAGVRLYRGGYYPQADRRFVQAIDYLEQIPAATWTDDVRDNWRVTVLNRANTLAKMDRMEDATEVLRSAIRRQPSDFDLFFKATGILLSYQQQDSAEEFLRSRRIGDESDWIGMLELTGRCFPDASVEQLRAKLGEAIEQSSLDTAIQSQLFASIKAPQRWRLLGPIQNADRAATEVTLLETLAASEFPGVERLDQPWRPLATFALNGIDLEETLAENRQGVCCYALAYLIVDEPQSAELFLGSDDSAAVWVNGEQLQESSGEGRSYIARQDRIGCELKAGINTLLVRIDQLGGRWKFGVQIDAQNGWPLPVEWVDAATRERRTPSSVE
ncbi:MAG: protein kinase [Planctomycetota bacterium]